MLLQAMVRLPWKQRERSRLPRYSHAAARGDFSLGVIATADAAAAPDMLGLGDRVTCGGAAGSATDGLLASLPCSSRGLAPFFFFAFLFLLPSYCRSFGSGSENAFKGDFPNDPARPISECFWYRKRSSYRNPVHSAGWIRNRGVGSIPGLAIRD